MTPLSLTPMATMLACGRGLNLEDLRSLQGRPVGHPAASLFGMQIRVNPLLLPDQWMLTQEDEDKVLHVSTSGKGGAA